MFFDFIEKVKLSLMNAILKFSDFIALSLNETVFPTPKRKNKSRIALPKHTNQEKNCLFSLKRRRRYNISNYTLGRKMAVAESFSSENMPLMVRLLIAMKIIDVNVGGLARQLETCGLGQRNIERARLSSISKPRKHNNKGVSRRTAILE